MDPEVLVEKDRRLNSGDFVNVTITSAMPFELIGTLSLYIAGYVVGQVFGGVCIVLFAVCKCSPTAADGRASGRYSGGRMAQTTLRLPYRLPANFRQFGRKFFCISFRKASHHEYTVYSAISLCFGSLQDGVDGFFFGIPLITGRMHSRPIEELEAEVRALTSRGVKEFNIIAQDLSSYGTDLGVGHRQLLPQMVERLADIPGGANAPIRSNLVWATNSISSSNSLSPSPGNPTIRVVRR